MRLHVDAAGVRMTAGYAGTYLGACRRAGSVLLYPPRTVNMDMVPCIAPVKVAFRHIFGKRVEILIIGAPAGTLSDMLAVKGSRSPCKAFKIPRDIVPGNISAIIIPVVELYYIPCMILERAAVSPALSDNVNRFKSAVAAYHLIYLCVAFTHALSVGYTSGDVMRGVIISVIKLRTRYLVVRQSARDLVMELQSFVICGALISRDTVSFSQKRLYLSLILLTGLSAEIFLVGVEPYRVSGISVFQFEANRGICF